MKQLYLEGILPILRPVCTEFDKLCRSHDVSYIIAEDAPAKQVFKLSKKSEDIIKAIREYAEANNVGFQVNDNDVTLSTGDLNQPKKCFVAVIDEDVQDKMMEMVIRYLGTRHSQLINESFRDLEVPTRMVDTESLWQTHTDHPRWAELGDRRNMYVNQQADFPPLVVDSMVSQGVPIRHSGVLVDGFRRLYASHLRGEPQVETMDIKDIINEYNTRLGVMEDQYKSPTRRMIRKQSAFPSSFGPSKSFGGVGGQDKYSKKEKATECYMGELGKLSQDLTAHDQKTIIPAGSVVRVVDSDKDLPDVWYDGRIINVDREALEAVWKPTSFSEHLDKAIVTEGKSKPKNTKPPSEFEDRISDAFGGTISIIEPDILFTVLPNQVVARE